MTSPPDPAFPGEEMFRETHYLTVEGGTRLAAAWVYERSCPLAVVLYMCNEGRIVRWTIDRGLLRDGLHCTRLQPAGLGDVVLHTRRVPHSVLVMDLRVPEAEVRLLLDWSIASRFLRRTYWAVTEERETALLVDRVDTAIAACLDVGTR